MNQSLCSSLSILALMSGLLVAQPDNEAVEPELKGSEVINLITDNSFEGWTVPSDRWSITDGVIAGDTKGKKLKTPEWLYTKQRYSDFIFTAEVKLSDGQKANSGIYYRVNTFSFEWRKTGTTYEAPSGYEYDATLGGKHNASLGDWYARPSLRIFPDQEVVKKNFRMEDWNRMTIRARGNRLEYWLNGVKVVDYVDHDPKRSHEGIIGLQIHDKIVMKVELRNASILPLGKAK